MDRHLRRQAVAQFLADALVDQHVGVDRHAQRQRDTGHAGQGQRRLQHRQQSNQQQQVGTQRQHRDGAEHQVVGDHEHGDHDETDLGGIETALDVVGAKAGADGALLDDLHRRRQRAGAQQQGDVLRLGGIHLAADLHPSAADFFADHRCGDNLAAPFFEQDDGHPLAHVLACRFLEFARADRIQIDVHSRFVVAAVKAGLRVADALAGEDHALLHQQLGAVAFAEHFRAKRGDAVGADLVFVIHHAHFQRGGAAKDVLGTRRILHAGQLHHHAVGALLLDHRLGHAELVNTVAQGD